MLHFLPTITLWSGTLSKFNHLAHLHFISLDLNYANYFSQYCDTFTKTVPSTPQICSHSFYQSAQCRL